MICPNCHVEPGEVHAGDCDILTRDQPIWSGKLPLDLMEWHPSEETQQFPEAMESEETAYREFRRDPTKFRFIPDEKR